METYLKRQKLLLHKPLIGHLALFTFGLFRVTCLAGCVKYKAHEKLKCNDFKAQLGYTLRNRTICLRAARSILHLNVIKVSPLLSVLTSPH